MMGECKVSVNDFGNNNRKIWLAFAIIVMMTFALFAPDLKNVLLEWDDSSYITHNEKIRTISLETVRWAFSGFYTNYWAPLTWLSYAFDYAFWGLNPVGYHLTNNLLHAFNAGLFFLLSLQLLAVSYFGCGAEKSTSDSRVFYTSLLAALLFSMHPLRVESVVWAAERKDVLSLFFGISAVLVYVRYTLCCPAPISTGKNLAFVASPYYWISLALYCCSLCSKSTLVTLPLVLLVIDWFPLKRLRTGNAPSLMLEKLLFLLCALLATVYTIVAHKQFGSIMPLEDASLFSRILLALKGIVSYLWFTLWPLDISPFYVHPGNIAYIDSGYVLAVFFFVALSSLSVWQVRRQPLYLSVWLVYLCTLLPLLGFVKGGNEGLAARFTYVPSLPISLLIAIAAISFIATQTGVRKISAILVVLLVVLSMGAVTVKHISFWKDDVTLWTRVIDLQPHATGRAYFQRSNAYLRIKDFQNALIDVNEALAIASKKQIRHLYPIYGTRAEILKNTGNNIEALADYGNAISSAAATHSPNLPQYYFARGTLHREMGNQSLADDDFKQAYGMEGGK